MKKFRYIKALEEKIENYSRELLKLKDQNKPKKLRDEIIEVNITYREKIRVEGKNNTRRCKNCDNVVHRASFAKHIRNEKYIETG